ncbi:MAG: Gfo/Idh/MocA family oxidoreductase, partial [Candidatus Bathyarchaeia archaeon]
MADRLNIGIVGCGSIAETHLKHLSKHRYVNLMGFCDVDPQRAMDKAKSYGSQDSKTYVDSSEMFSLPLDAAFFFLPPFAHGAEVKAAEKGIPFFVEKPVEISMEGSMKILEKVREKDVITSVGYMNRYRKGVNVAKEEFKRDRVILALGGWIGGTPRNDNWWVVKSKSGGQFHEQVTHTVDLVRYVCGEVKEVQAYCAHGLNKGIPKSYDVEDASVVNIKLDHGGVVNLCASCSSNSYGGVFLNIYAYETAAIFTGWEHNLKLLKTGADPLEFKGEPNIFEIEDNMFIEAVMNDDVS